MELPSEARLRWLLRTTATLLSFGAEPVRGLVTPTGEHFPDAYDGSPASVASLLARVQEHAGLRDLSVELTMVSPEGATVTVGCSSGACGGGGHVDARLDRVARRDDGSYGVTVAAAEARSPVALTTALVRSVAFMFLTEADGYDAFDPEEREAATDVAAVLLGFGPLVANGSYIFMKGCSGVAVHSATRLPVEEIAVAVAVFARLHDVDERAVAKHLSPTARAAFEEAAVWAKSNAHVVRMLRRDPEAIEKDLFSLSPARSWLARALGLGKPKSVRATDEELAALERELATSARAKAPKDPEREKRLAELRSLVDEALEGQP